MSSNLAVRTRVQKQPSKAKARKPYAKPLIEEMERKIYSKPRIDERTVAEFEESMIECKRVIDYRINKKIGEAMTLGLEYSDLKQAALEGVFKAWITYNPEKGGLSTWAGHKIRGEITKTLNQAYGQRGSHNRYTWIIRGYDEALRIYNGEQEGFPKISIAVAVLEELKEGKRTEEEIIEKREKAEMILNRRKGCFLEDKVKGKVNDGDENFTIMSRIENRMAEDWEEPDIELDDLKGLIWESLNVLDERQRYIILNRYLENEATLQELGDKFGFSRERARQIEAKAFRKLKMALQDNPMVLSRLTSVDTV